MLEPSVAGAEAPLRRNLRLMALGAWTVFLAQLLSLGSALLTLGDESGTWPVSVFLSTTSTRGRISREPGRRAWASAAVRGDPSRWL